MAEAVESYDGGLMADVRGAFDEVAKGVPVEPAQAELPLGDTKESVEPKTPHPADERRNADGTFKATKTDDEPPKQPVAPREPVKAADDVPKADVVPQPPAVQGNPPPGWSVKSKTEWDKLPDHIRADIIKREKEVSDGFAQYAGMKELQPYVEMARSRGQTLKSALDHYTGIEAQLAQDPLRGLLQIAQNIGYAPQRLAMELSPLLGQSNGQGGQQQGHQQPAPTDQSFLQYLNPLQQKLATLEGFLQQQHQAAQTRELGAVNSTLDRFKSDPAHRYFDNLEPQIIKLFEGGVIPRTGDHAADLKTAYELACRMDPEISETLFNERIAKSEAGRKQQQKEAAEKAKQASRSLTGSSGGAAPNGAADDESIEETVRKAYRAHAV